MENATSGEASSFAKAASKANDTLEHFLEHFGSVHDDQWYIVGQERWTDQRGHSVDSLLVGEEWKESLICTLLHGNVYDYKAPNIEGELLLTNFRLFFKPNSGVGAAYQWMIQSNLFKVPFGVIESVRVEDKVNIKVVTRDNRTLVFALTSAEGAERVGSLAMAMSYPQQYTSRFAFLHAETLAVGEPENVCDLIRIYESMGAESNNRPNPESPWKVMDINHDYSLCESYPKWIVLPRDATSELVRSVATARGKGRIQAMSWCGGKNMGYASLWRCAQPKDGLFRGSQDDGKMVSLIRGKNMRKLLTVDLRPKAAAMANKATGGGYESYEDCRVVFAGIDNIHHVRDSWIAMSKATCSVSSSNTGTWHKDIADSRWYDLISVLLGATKLCIEEIHEFRSNVMIHCTDGWDRTSQVSALVALCLDASFRTRVGFCTLIQKEFCSFGHPFKMRLGIEKDTDQCSPVFIQWLECVFQVLCQYPNEFEFTSDFLLRLADEAYSGRTGTFLYDIDKERAEAEKATLSLWSELCASLPPAEYLNTEFRYGSKFFDSKSTEQLRQESTKDPLQPSICQKLFSVWEDYWFRYHPLKYERHNGFTASQVHHLRRAKAEAIVSLKNAQQRISELEQEIRDLREGSQRLMRFRTEDENDKEADFCMETSCMLCNVQLGKRQFQPRHHCRLCGKTVCGNCSPNTIQVKGNLQRACNSCVLVIAKSSELKKQLADNAKQLNAGLGSNGDEVAETIEESVAHCTVAAINFSKAAQTREESLQERIQELEERNRTLSNQLRKAANMASALSKKVALNDPINEVENEQKEACDICSAPVGKRQLNPRHHCKVCRACVCAKCSPNLIRIEGFEGVQRACTPCVSGIKNSTEWRSEMFALAKFMEGLCNKGTG